MGTRASDPMEVLSFKVRLSRRRLLEAIQAQRGHGSMGETLREAMEEYIARHLQHTVDDIGGENPPMRRDAAA